MRSMTCFNIHPLCVWRACLVAGWILVLALAGCSTELKLPTPTEQILEQVEESPSATLMAPPSPTYVQETAAPTQSPTANANPTLIPSPTSSPKVTVYVPERWRDHALSTLSSPSIAKTSWEWQFVNDPALADITMIQESGAILAGERPIALIVPFTSPIHEMTVEEAEQILREPNSDIVAVGWDEIPTGYRAIRINGLLPNSAEYQLIQEWSLSSTSEHQAQAILLGSALSEQLGAQKMIHLTTVGDIMLDRSLGYAIESGDINFPFANVSDSLSAADITVGNLESSLGNTGEPVLKSYNFQSPPEAAQSLSLAGFDLVSLANNHAMDFGPQALLQAIDLLEANNIQSVGAGADMTSARAPVILELNNVSIGFLAYVDVPVEVTGFDTKSWEAGDNRPGVAWASPEHISDDVRSAAEKVDVVVVILHSGYEFQQQPSPPQINSAEAAIEAGASLVISHHSHLLQGIDFYDDGVIVYGLGNFAFNMDGSPDSAILNVWLDEKGVHNIDLVPITIGLAGQPGYASPADSWRIREEVYHMTRLLNQP